MMIKTGSLFFQLLENFFKKIDPENIEFRESSKKIFQIFEKNFLLDFYISFNYLEITFKRDVIFN